MGNLQRAALLRGWRKAVGRSLNWDESTSTSSTSTSVREGEGEEEEGNYDSEEIAVVSGVTGKSESKHRSKSKSKNRVVRSNDMLINSLADNTSLSLSQLSISHGSHGSHGRPRADSASSDISIDSDDSTVVHNTPTQNNTQADSQADRPPTTKNSLSRFMFISSASVSVNGDYVDYVQVSARYLSLSLAWWCLDSCGVEY